MDNDGYPRPLAEMHFVEDVGLLFEHDGHPRMAGRIIGWLMICEPPHQSMDELAQTLNASKASISTMTRLLIQMSLVERVGLPGERRDHFRVKSGAWTEMMRESKESMMEGRKLADHGLSLLKGKSSERKRRLKEFRAYYAFFEKEYPAMVERWEREQKKAAR